MGQPRTWTRNDALAVVAAALLLFAVAIPTLASKLDAARSARFTFGLPVAEPVCVPSGYCFRAAAGSFERSGTAYRLPLSIAGVDNVYRLAKELDEDRLRAVAVGSAVASSRIAPAYTTYINVDEVARQIGAFLEFERRPSGRITVAFEHNGAASKSLALDIHENDLGRLDGMLASADPKYTRTGLGILILLIALTASVLEVRLAADGALLAPLLLARLLALIASGAIASPVLHLLAALAILMPWLAICVRWTAGGRGGRTEAAVAARTDPLWQGDRVKHRVAPLELAVLALTLAVFAYMLWFDASFRWSIFEERDFLEARQVIAKLAFPLYGPELLMGGHTIGGGLYLFLAPMVALWNDPEALRLLNQLLFLGMAVVLWWGLRDWTGPAGALFAVLALVASERIVALSYWPIHPNFSLFFAFLYAAAVLRGAVGGHRGWLIFSGLLLGFLVELHFSYFLLVLCHLVLVLLGKAQRQRWTRPLAIAAVFVPLAPSLAIDAAHGFPNIAQILERPRFHGLYPDRLFGNAGLLPLVFGWVRQASGPLSQPFSQLVVLLIGVGSAAASKRSGRGGMTAAMAAALLLCVPLFTLTVMGMGYNSRHTLAIAPALFMLAGFGFAGIVSLLRPARSWIAVVGLLPLLLVVAWRSADSANMTRITRSEGEWAIDYKSREAIARDLALRLGVSPEIYARRTFWWWVGWSIDPAIYADIFRRVAPKGVQPTPPPPDQYVLVIDRADLLPFLETVFVSLSSRPVAGMHVHVVTPKPEFAGTLPSSNADTGVRLHPFLQEVDLVRHGQEGFFRIAEHRAGGARRDLFLGLMAQGRIKLLVAIEQAQVGNRSRLRWCVDSPSLNGHYQEIKTVWRPRLMLTPHRAAPVRADLAGDVLGSLPFKAPRCGEAWSEQAGSWQISFALDGLFDQSFMSRPDLTSRQWPLAVDAPLKLRLLPQKAASEWLKSRFDP